MFAWLGGWTVGGFFAIYCWLWNVKGQETINLSTTELQHIRRMPFFQKSKEYDLSSMRKLRAQVQNGSMFGFNNHLEF